MDVVDSMHLIVIRFTCGLLLASSNPVSCYYTFDNATRMFSVHGALQIPRIPPETRTVHILHSRLININTNAISNLHHCVQIKIINNKISTIQPGAFNGLPSLRTLELRGNTITQIKTGAFIGSQQLKLLKVWKNNFTTMEAHAFKWSSRCTKVIKKQNVWINPNRAAFKGPGKISSTNEDEFSQKKNCFNETDDRYSTRDFNAESDSGRLITALTVFGVVLAACYIVKIGIFCYKRTHRNDRNNNNANNNSIKTQGVYTYPSSSVGYLYPDISFYSNNTSDISTVHMVSKVEESSNHQRELSTKSSSSSNEVYTDLFPFSTQNVLPSGGSKDDSQFVLIY